MAAQGKFFVLEGVDGSGGETQAAKLAKLAEKRSVSAIRLSYPDYEGPIAKIIQDYLYGKHNFSKEVQFLLYVADFLKDKEKIHRLLKEGKTIIADRYITSTLAYQCVNGLPREHVLQILRMLAPPIPDQVFLLQISAGTSIARKTKEKQGNLDRNEADRQFLSDLAHAYKELADGNVFAPWKIIDGEQSIEYVTDSIWQHMSPQLG